MKPEERVVVRLDDGQGLRRELELIGMKLVQRSSAGRAEPQESSTRFENLKEAKEQLEFLVSRYLRQGFKEVSRVSGRVDAAAVAHQFSQHAEYEAACLASPDDVQPWQIYADWLQERGDVRGELAALFLGKSEQAAWDRLDAERDTILGPHSERELLDLNFTHGFLTGATIKRASYDSETDLAALIADFLSRPISRFVSQLNFGDVDRRHQNWNATGKVLLDAPQAKQLRKLELGDFGDVSELWKAMPALEHLHLRSEFWGRFEGIAHPKLKTLIRESQLLRRADLDAIVNADLPALERFEVSTGTVPTSTPATSDQLLPVLEGKRFPRLTHLAVRNSELTAELLRQLGRSPLLARLRVLDLSRGSLGDADADSVLRLAPKLAHLELDLSGNYFSERFEEVREALPRAVLNDQRQESERYDGVAE